MIYCEKDDTNVFKARNLSCVGGNFRILIVCLSWNKSDDYLYLHIKIKVENSKSILCSPKTGVNVGIKDFWCTNNVTIR